MHSESPVGSHPGGAFAVTARPRAIAAAQWCGALCAAESGTKRRADLVGERDRDHSWLKWHLVARSGSEDEAAQVSPAVLDQELDLGSGKAHAIDAPDPAAEQHVPVVLEAHHGTRTGPSS